MENYIHVGVQQQLIKCFEVYGIEGTEDKINEIYKKMPTLKKLFLDEYQNILKGRHE